MKSLTLFFRFDVMKHTVYFLTLLLFSFLCLFTGISCSESTQTLETTPFPYDLTIEGLSNPEGIDALNPRFSWKTDAAGQSDIVQQAYQLVVASSEEKLEQGDYDCWNSGRVKSGEQLWIAYEGLPLQSKTAYFWQVKIWTNRGESEFSATSRWSMGLFSDVEWKGQWIGMDRLMPFDSETQWSRLSARYLRKEFRTRKEIKRATAYIAGLGLYELFINGQRIGNQVLAPAPTDYRKSILYNTYDVTNQLQQGDNAIGVILGNGRYFTMRQYFKTHKINNFGYPKLRFNLTVEFADGSTQTISSNTSWKLHADGPIRANNEYDGEEYDANKEFGAWTAPGFDDSKWMTAERVSIPIGTLKAQMMEGMKVVESMHPVSITKKGNRYILDMGQNIVGWLRIQVRGNQGDKIKIRFAETLQEDGELYTENLRDALVTDIYTCKGDQNGEDWAPSFVYHGFRYAEISGLRYQPDTADFIGEVVSDDMQLTGEVKTSNEVLNQVLQNAFWGIRGNYKGMPVDCPQRNERQPWLGDRTMGSLGESFLFGNHNLYSKWMDDISEAQRYDGAVPDVAPAFWNYYSDNVTWPAAFPMACAMLYRQFGDMQPIRKHYPAIKQWMAYMAYNYMTEDYIVTKDSYGDWCVPPESPELIHSKDPKRKTEGALIATAYFYHLSELMAEFAQLQGIKEDVQFFNRQATQIKEGFNRKFLRQDSLFYGNNSTTSNVLPLSFGMVPEHLKDSISKQILGGIMHQNLPKITTGVIGIQWLHKVLLNMDRGDVAFDLSVSEKYPSWGYMAANGATTIWELWNGDTANPAMNSGNHVMLLGGLIPWVFEDLAGIKTDPSAPAFRHLIMKPDFNIPDLEWVDASYETPYGKVVSQWRKTLMHLDWTIEIPANTTAEVHLPNGKIKKIGSGKHQFNIDIPQQKKVLANEFIYEKASFPQCHAATITELPNGDLLSAWFGGTYESHPDVCIYTARKEKGSAHWSTPQLVADGVLDNGVRKACYNPVLFQEPDGPLWLFYKVGNRVVDWTAFCKSSHDGGHTWSQAIPLPEGYLGPIKNKIEVIDGKFIAPSSTENKGWQIHFEIAEKSGDGYSHRYIGPIEAGHALPSHKLTDFSELTSQDPEILKQAEKYTIQAIQPSILKHKDGSLQVLCRGRSGRIVTSWSYDRGESWSPLELTDLPNNNSGTDAVTLQDGRHLLVYNAVATAPGERKGPRTPLNVAISNDGIHWEMIMTLEDSPISQYSYPSVIQTSDGHIHIVYTWRRLRVKHVELVL